MSSIKRWFDRKYAKTVIRQYHSSITRNLNVRREVGEQLCKLCAELGKRGHLKLNGDFFTDVELREALVDFATSSARRNGSFLSALMIDVSKQNKISEIDNKLAPLLLASFFKLSASNPGPVEALMSPKKSKSSLELTNFVITIIEETSGDFMEYGA